MHFEDNFSKSNDKLLYFSIVNQDINSHFSTLKNVNPKLIRGGRSINPYIIRPYEVLYIRKSMKELV